MKKLIVVFFALITPLLLGAQEEMSIEEMDILFNPDQAILRIDKNSTNYFYLRTTVKLREDKFEISEGVVFPFGDKIRVFVGLGFEQVYGIEGIGYIVHGSFRGAFDWGKVKINYGSNWTSYKVSSSIVFNLSPSFRVGISSGDEFIGPRLEYEFTLKKTKLRIHVTRLNNTIDYGINIKI